MYENTLIFMLIVNVVLITLAYRYASRADALRREAKSLRAQIDPVYRDCESARAEARDLRLRHAALVQTIRATDAEAGANLRCSRQWRDVVQAATGEGR